MPELVTGMVSAIPPADSLCSPISLFPMSHLFCVLSLFVSACGSVGMLSIAVLLFSWASWLQHTWSSSNQQDILPGFSSTHRQIIASASAGVGIAKCLHCLSFSCPAGSVVKRGALTILAWDLSLVKPCSLLYFHLPHPHSPAFSATISKHTLVRVLRSCSPVLRHLTDRDHNPIRTYIMCDMLLSISFHHITQFCIIYWTKHCKQPFPRQPLFFSIVFEINNHEK